MKNLISFLSILAVLFFTSCTKEEVPQNGRTIESVGAFWSTIDVLKAEGEAAERSTVLQIAVSNVFVQANSGVLETTFSSNYDLTGIELEPIQYLDFEDANGNTVLLTFEVVSHVAGNGVLEADFSIGSNNLSGLTLKEVQDIIIIDDFIE